jgi:hypothetical protein
MIPPAHVTMERTRIRAVVLALVALGATSGCLGLTAEQKRAVGDFSRAAAVVGQATAEELPQLRASAIEMNAARYGLVGDKSGLKFTDLEQQFTVANVGTVVRAATTLQAYGVLLLGLVEDMQKRELHGAAADFVGGAKKLPGVSLSDNQADAIRLAVELVGGVVVEWKKKRAVEDVVANARAAVGQICGLLAAEFDPASGRLGAQYFNITSPLRVEASDTLQNAKAPTERTLALEAYRQAIAGQVRHEQVLKRISATATALRSANEALVAALASDKLKLADVKEAVALGRAVAESKAVADLARELFESVQTLR